MRLGPRDGHVEQPKLLVHGLRLAEGIAGGQHAVERVDDEDRVKLQPLRRVDRREDERRLVLLERLHVQRRELDRIERQGGEKLRAAREAVGQPAEVLQILRALRIVLVILPLEDRLVIPEHRLHLPGEGRPRPTKGAERLEKRRQRLDVLRPERPVFEHERILRLRGDPADEVLRRLRPDALDELKDAVPRDGVLRVFGHFQMRQHVLDVRRLAEFEAAVLHERDVPAVEFDFEVVRVEAAPEEDGHAVEGDALLAQFEHHLADEPALEAVVRRGHQGRALAVAFLREELLVVLLPGVHDEVVGEVEDGLGGAVVLFELEQAGAGELLGEGEDVPEVGPAKAIDALRVVADGHDVAVDRGEAPHEGRLGPVRILILVHEHMTALPRHAPPHFVVGVEELDRAGEEVVIVHERVRLLVLYVRVQERPEVVGIDMELRILLFEDVVEGQSPVGDGREKGLEGLFSGKTFACAVEAVRGAEHVEHVGGIGGVEDGEVVREADAGGIPPQEAGTEGVERAALHTAAPSVEQGRGAGEHLAGGAARERQQHDLLRGRPRLDEVGHAIDERACLAGARPRDDEHRPAGRRRRRVLLRVQLPGIVDREPPLDGVGVGLENEASRHGKRGVGAGAFRPGGAPHTRARHTAMIHIGGVPANARRPPAPSGSRATWRSTLRRRRETSSRLRLSHSNWRKFRRSRTGLHGPFFIHCSVRPTPPEVCLPRRSPVRSALSSK